jgi:hypothetical protein
MLKFYVRLRVNPKETSKTAEERGKLVMLYLEGVRSDLQTGVMKDWGSCVDGSGGYCIYEVPSEADVFASLRRWMPHLSFDAREVLTVEQLLESRKGDAPRKGKQIS